MSQNFVNLNDGCNGIYYPLFFLLPFADAGKHFDNGYTCTGILLCIPVINIIVDLILRMSCPFDSSSRPLEGRVETSPKTPAAKKTGKMARATFGDGRAQLESPRLPPSRPQTRKRRGSPSQLNDLPETQRRRSSSPVRAAGRAATPPPSARVRAMYQNMAPPTREDDGADYGADIAGLTEFVRDALVAGRVPLDNIILQVYERGGLHLPTARIEEILRNACATAPGSPDPEPLLEAWITFRYASHLNPRNNPGLYPLLQHGNYHDNYGAGDCQFYALIKSHNLIRSKRHNHGMESRDRAVRTQQRLRERLIGIFMQQMIDLEGGRDLRERFAYALLWNELGGLRIGAFHPWERELFIQHGTNPIPANRATLATLRAWHPRLTLAELPAALERIQANIARVLQAYTQALGRRGTENNQLELELVARYYRRAVILLDFQFTQFDESGFPAAAQVDHTSISGAQFLPRPENLDDRLPLVIGRWPGHYITPTAPFGLAH